MTFDLYATGSGITVSFAHFLIGSSKRVLLQRLFLFFLHVVLFYNTGRLMSQMYLTKKTIMDLDLNLGQLVRLVPDLLGCCMT